jgi:hypothetical protein
MDSKLRAEIVATVKQAMLTYNEKWVTAEVLCEHVGTLTPRFMKDHGQMFNRTRVEWNDERATMPQKTGSTRCMRLSNGFRMER